jgi:predicted branched-subunit amino acid permease
VTPPGRPFPQGARAALGAPAVAMGATFLAFGAAVAEAGLGLGWALGASWGVYGMAGQLVLLQGAGGAVLPAVLGATAANARFLPMAVALAPLLGRRRWPALPFIAITPWAAAMRTLPALPEAARLPWFLGFALASFLAAGAATAAGFALAPFLPRAVLAGLLFANPLYFALLLAGDLGRPGVRAAVLAGLAAAPLVPLLPGAGGLPLAGVLAGTAAFLWERR